MGWRVYDSKEPAKIYPDRACELCSQSEVITDVATKVGIQDRSKTLAHSYAVGLNLAPLAIYTGLRP